MGAPFPTLAAGDCNVLPRMADGKRTMRMSQAPMAGASLAPAAPYLERFRNARGLDK